MNGYAVTLNNPKSPRMGGIPPRIPGTLPPPVSSRRARARWLALLLGACLALPGCGDEESPSPTTPAPPPVPAPPEPALTTPENLRITGRGADYLEWSWNPVAGAPAYQAQFSPDDTFTPADATYLVIAPATSLRVGDLPANMTGGLRVRSAGGTSLANREFSDWSEPVRGATTPAAGGPLTAPRNLSASGVEEDSVTLRWDGVEGAGSYEVEQREPEGRNVWEAAGCEGADPGNRVESEECVAGGLEAGTDYDFRVRAVPADSDRHRESAWSAARAARTEGTRARPPEPATGGMGNLDVRWTSDAEGIMWTWDRVHGATYDYAIVTGGDLPPRGSSDPCAGATYDGARSDVADTYARQDDPVALLCVRTNNPDDESENLSFAWAVKPPSAPAAPEAGGVSPAGDSARETRALTWTGIGVEAGFGYEMNVVADPERRNDIRPDHPAGEALQRACGAGQFHESGETDAPLTDLETTLRRVRPYTGYLLCLRLRNVAGATDWVVPDGNAEHQTAPGAPRRPAKDEDRSDDDRDTGSEKIVWNVETRGNDHLPRGPDGFTLRVIQHPDRTDGDDADTFHDDAVTRPRAEDCGDSDIQSGDYTSPEATTALTGQGFAATLSVPRPTGEQEVASGRNEVIPIVVSLCVQARYAPGGDERLGPWTISAAETVERQRE